MEARESQRGVDVTVEDNSTCADCDCRVALYIARQAMQEQAKTLRPCIFLSWLDGS